MKYRFTRVFIVASISKKQSSVTKFLIHILPTTYSLLEIGALYNLLRMEVLITINKTGLSYIEELDATVIYFLPYYRKNMLRNLFEKQKKSTE
jgi:hypothetical protein